MFFLDRAVGIDLGTTNSEIAWLPPSEREIVIHADRFGRRTVPSAVAWDDASSGFVVGHAARAKRGAARPPIESVKRKMGQRATVSVGPHELSPEEVSAKILEELVARMRGTLAEQKLRAAGGEAPELRITRAVITVPAYFDAPQVEATRRAGELAGLEVIGILQEPTAAAIYHTWKRRLGDGTFLVYDLGGGTFDVSILRCTAGEYQVLAIDGDNYLGGDDLDRRFAEQLRKELVGRGYALDLDVKGSAEDRTTFGRLVHLAQEIKESLSTADVVHVSKNDFLTDKKGEAVSYEGDVGRADYERAVSDLVEATLACCDRALARAKEVSGIELADVDHVILVGGSTRVPLVVRSVTERFVTPAARARTERDGDAEEGGGARLSAEPIRDDVDTCVALGAAVHAAHLGGTLLGQTADGARPAARFRVSSPLVAQGSRLRLGLVGEEIPAQAARIAIWDGDRDLAEGAASAEPTRFDLALAESEETLATLAVQSPVGLTLAELPLTLYRGDLRPRPTALSRASVVAKDVAVEVVRGGRRERKVLLGRGQGLPAQASQTFFTVDQSGAVVLRILQNRLPIKTLVVEVPRDLPVGTAVAVVLRCDESMRLEAQATIGAQQVQAHVEPPQAPTHGEIDVDELLERVESARRSMWGDIGDVFARESERLVAAIREVVHTDPDKLDALCHRLDRLVSELHGAPGEAMTPPMARMEAAFDALRRVVYRSSGAVMGMERVEVERRVDALHERAMTAYESDDGAAWRRAYNEVQALTETAYQEEFTRLRLDDPAYVQRRVSTALWRAREVEVALDELVLSTADEIASLQRSERERLRTWLRDAVTKPLEALGNGTGADLAEVRRTLDALSAELERIEAAAQRLPSIGLVTDRGG